MEVYPPTDVYNDYGADYAYGDYITESQYDPFDPYNSYSYADPALDTYAEEYDYDDPGGILIEDEYFDDDPSEEEVWLPYTPPPPSSSDQAGSGQQQVVLAGFPGMFPPTELSGSWCNLHPAECARQHAPVSLNSTCVDGNGTDGRNGTSCGEIMAADKGLGRALGKVDLSGLGMVLLIAMLLLVGLHFGWDSEKKPGKSGDKDKERGGSGKLYWMRNLSAIMLMDQSKRRASLIRRKRRKKIPRLAKTMPRSPRKTEGRVRKTQKLVVERAGKRRTAKADQASPIVVLARVGEVGKSVPIRVSLICLLQPLFFRHWGEKATFALSVSSAKSRRIPIWCKTKPSAHTSCLTPKHTTMRCFSICLSEISLTLCSFGIVRFCQEGF